jgi:cytoskeletal protein CcmA (bactofilin family)
MRLALFLAALTLAGAAAADDATVRMGGNIDISEAVPGDLHVMAGHVTVEAPVAGNASLAGGSIEVSGPVTGNLRAAGGHVKIDGPVGGDANIAAGTLELGPEARIAGKLSFHGGDLRRDPAAEVTGPIETSAARGPHHERHYVSKSTHGWIWTAGLLVLAALIAAVLPGPSRRMAQELSERPWLTTLVGFVALTSIPVAALLLLVTIIGIPLGLLAIAAYAGLLLVGYVGLAVVVGGLLLDRVRPGTAAMAAWRAGAAVLAMLALALLARLPIVGGFVILAALAVGVGMIVAAMMRRAAPSQPAQVA